MVIPRSGWITCFKPGIIPGKKLLSRQIQTTTGNPGKTTVD